LERRADRGSLTLVDLMAQEHPFHLRVGFSAYGTLEFAEDRRSLVGRAVIDNNNLNSLEKLGLGEDFQALEARIH